MAQKAASRGLPSTLQSSATSGNGNVLALPNSFHEHIVYINGSAGVASGAVQIETADDPNYAGTWAKLTASPTTVVASTEISVNISGILRFLRARISTPIVGGTVSVTYEGS